MQCLLSPVNPACKLPGMMSCNVSGVQLCSNKAMYTADNGTKIQSDCMSPTVSLRLGVNSICSTLSGFSKFWRYRAQSESCKGCKSRCAAYQGKQGRRINGASGEKYRSATKGAYWTGLPAVFTLFEEMLWFMAMASLENTLSPETCCGFVALCDTKETWRLIQGQVGLCWKALPQHSNEVLLRKVVSGPTYSRATAGAYCVSACPDVLHA